MKLQKVATSAGVCVLTIDAPPVNAIDADGYKQIAETFAAISDDRDIRCVVLVGAGEKAFCAGKNLRELQGARIADDAVRAEEAATAYRSIYNCRVATIAALNGAALGAGAVIASVCDIRIAAENAVIGLPEINVGRCGGAAHLARHLPQGVVRRMMLTGEPITAARGAMFGFIDEVVPPMRLLSAAMALAQNIAAKSPLGLRYAKAALNEAEFLAVEEGFSVEQRASRKLLETADAREALQAALEKRKPAFRGE